MPAEAGAKLSQHEGRHVRPAVQGLIFTRSVQTCGFERRVPPSLTQLPSLQTEVTMATRKDVRGHRGTRVCPGRAGLPVLSVATAAF